jgi:hypothetical protein
MPLETLGSQPKIWAAAALPLGVQKPRFFALNRNFIAQFGKKY